MERYKNTNLIYRNTIQSRSTNMTLIKCKWRSGVTGWFLVIMMFVVFRSFISLISIVPASETPETFNKAHVQSIYDLGNVAKSHNQSELKSSSDPLSEKLDIILAKPKCLSLTRPGKEDIMYYNRHWQMVKEHQTMLFAYSAFYDDRLVTGELPIVRILTVSVRLPKRIYCHIWYADYPQPYVIMASVLTTGRGDKFYGVKYDQNMISCSLPLSYPIPTHVSLTTTTCTTSSIYLPINVDVRSKYDQQFGICVAIAFGQIPTSEFVEWMEFHTMMGVTEVNIYNGSISANMSHVFRYYEERGTLRVFPMPPPIDDFSKKGVKLSSPASLNDCMMRNWFRYQFIVLVDFDEFIVPKKHIDYGTMLSSIDADKNLQSPWRSYSFRNEYYFRDLEQDMTQPNHLKTMRFRRKVHYSNFLYAAKSFVDPRKCLSVFNHYCYKRFASENSKPVTIDVNAMVATSHHYRECSFGEDRCNKMKTNITIGDEILRFKPELDNRVKKSLTAINAK